MAELSITEALQSPYLWAIVSAWLIAHVIKYIVMGYRGNKVDLAHQLFISGGMPSSHATTVVAVWTVTLLDVGAGSPLFGIVMLFALIVCYDAVKVRRSSGEQGEAIAGLISATKADVRVPRAAKGHTPVEVAAGAVLGVIIGSIVFITTN